jgi:hypothetical protein
MLINQSRIAFCLKSGLSTVAALAFTAILVPAGAAPPPSNDSGPILIADQYNNRVIEVDRATHDVIWSFGNGSQVPGPHSVVGVNDAERFGTYTLITGTGIPPSNPPLPGCTDPATGCPDNRVFIVNQGGSIVWQYGQAGVTGFALNELNTPVQSLILSNFPGRSGTYVLITDQGNQRVILVSMNGNIAWQYGTTGVAGSGFNQLNSPNSAEVLSNGHILIADESNNRVIEVTTQNQIVHTFTAQGTISGAAFASRLANGDTLISDGNNNRIVEVNSSDEVVWQYVTNLGHGSHRNPLPSRGVRLSNGDTLISDQYNDRVIEVNSSGAIVFQQGSISLPGNGFNQLNGPYDAKEIGDFTGLTVPPTQP